MYELREKKEEGTKKPVWKKAAACILALLLFFACSALLYVTKLATSTQKIPDADIKAISNDYLNEATEKQMDDYWTVAIFGVDSRNGNIGKGTSADTQMLLTLNRANGEIRLVSVYRDTLLMSNVKEGKCRKINSSYTEGGPEQAVTALNENLDLKIGDTFPFPGRRLPTRSTCWGESIWRSQRRSMRISMPLSQKPWIVRESLRYI